MTRLEGFVVELLVTGLSEMTLGSRREQISSLRRCSNHLHPGPGQLPHWEKARESQSLQQRPPRPSIWQSVNWERKESTRSHFRLELCRDGHVWTMMLECPVLLVVCPTEGIFMIVLEHIVYLYVHWVLCIFYFACLFMCFMCLCIFLILDFCLLLWYI